MRSVFKVLEWAFIIASLLVYIIAFGPLKGILFLILAGIVLNIVWSGIKRLIKASTPPINTDEHRKKTASPRKDIDSD